MTKHIVGYSSEISVLPGQQLDFMVSCYGVESYSAAIVRLIHGDVNPAGPGLKTEVVDAVPSQSFAGREQKVHCGSYGLVSVQAPLREYDALTLRANIWPTTPDAGRRQAILSWSEHGGPSCRLGIGADGCLEAAFGAGSELQFLSSGVRLVSRQWYGVAAMFDSKSGTVAVYQVPLRNIGESASGQASTAADALSVPTSGSIVIAASSVGEGMPIVDHYNGKIELPNVVRGVRSAPEIQAPIDTVLSTGDDLIAAWDFSKDIGQVRISDVSGNQVDGELVNLPTRAMKGSNWTGERMSWKDAPDQYGAIHFHDDDLYDAGWEVDFSIQIPQDLASGVYAAHLEGGGSEDYIPFFVRPGEGSNRADIVFVVPTTSYIAYANEHMGTDAPLAQLLSDQVIELQDGDTFLIDHREFGGSLYDNHSDGSGICHSSRLRPILNMRPKHSNFLGGAGSSLWQFNADTHITDWLEHEGFKFDVITDEDLHREGSALLGQYRVAITGTHPEYTTEAMRNAYKDYSRDGGRLIYMGGNGFYWRTSHHESLPGVIELRRAECGIRAWEAQTGEYYNAFTGEYSGLWRRSGFAPQELVGVGFSAQGFDVSSYYVRSEESLDSRAQFIFDGIGADERIGDFGLIGGGAAGLELDRADVLLGTPPHALVVASSEGHTDVYMVVCEEILINSPGLHGTLSPLVRADLVFFETTGGGAVFSTGSIAFCGSLSHRDYSNNISRMMHNVLD